MRILATDLDRTLLPNGRWEADPGAIPMFNELTRLHGAVVVYVTGRNLALTEQAIEQYGVRHPDVLCGDVGTSVRKWTGDEWETDEGWLDHVRRTSPRWDAVAIRRAAAAIEGIREQEAEHQNSFKQSYYVDHHRKVTVLREFAARVEGRFDEAIVYSFDPQGGKGLLDVLPASATKRTALEYVADSLGCPRDEAVFCGDSGNDILPLTAGFCGVLVKNADEELVARVKQALEKDPALRVYFARGGFRGLNGYYASGVIEGAYHYGVLR